MSHEEDYYYYLRTIARKLALEEINKRIQVDGGAADWMGTEFASISDEAIDYAEQIWPKYYGDDTHTGFRKPWSSIWGHSQLQPSNFNVAIWQLVKGARVLQGMAVGSTSHGKTNLSLNWVERNFGPGYIRFGTLVPILSCFEHYAHLLDAERVLIKNPVDPSLYQRYGYEPMKLQGATRNVEFLGKELKDG